MNSLSKEDLAYLAGLFEGEACFTIKKQTKTAVIHINMTDKDVLDYVQAVVGLGSVIPKGKTTDKRKPVWMWEIYGPNALHLMDSIFPYMKSRRQARILEIKTIIKIAREEGQKRLRSEGVNKKRLESRAKYWLSSNSDQHRNNLRAGLHNTQTLEARTKRSESLRKAWALRKSTSLTMS